MEIHRVLDIMLSAIYKKAEKKNNSVLLLGYSSLSEMKNKFKLPEYELWKKNIQSLQMKVSPNLKVIDYTFPRNEYFAVRIIQKDVSNVHEGVYFQKSAISPFGVIYCIESNNKYKISYPSGLDQELIREIKLIYSSNSFIEFPHKYWMDKPDLPYYSLESEPDIRLNYYDLFFGGSDVYKREFAPINEYGLMVEKNYLSELGSIVMIGE